MTDQSHKRFSRRYGFSSRHGEDLIREDAPESLRCGLLQIVGGKLEKKPSWLRCVVCGTLRVRPNPSNWSDYPNVWEEVEGLVHGCDWFRVYDVIEAIHNALDQKLADGFEEMTNSLFREEGIGWQLVKGEIQTRGDDASEKVLRDGVDALNAAGMATAASEMREAIRDLSRRPEPDLSGAVHHAAAALECTAREISGDARPTLGQIVKKCPELFPRPVGEAVAKLWGYASEQARHAREARDLAWEEAQLVVGVSASLCSYIVQKRP